MNTSNIEVYFISGHIDLEQTEFDIQYKPLIDKALLNHQSHFVMGDASGADDLAKKYLISKIDLSRMKIFSLNPEKIRKNNPGIVICGPFRNHEEKDSAMTHISQYDIAYVRPSEIQKQRLESIGIKYDPTRLSGTEKNLLRRKNNK